MVLHHHRRAGGIPRPKAGRLPANGVAVDDEQRRRLAECCAFFLASRFRPSRPGGYRKQDLAQAEASIDAIIRKHRPK
jgi:hypothetical protein